MEQSCSGVIAAISTGQVVSGIGVIRMSGTGALAVLDRVFIPDRGGPMSGREDRKLVLGVLRDVDGAVLDRCLATVSRGPRSYTGEDTAELQCHGSPTVLSQGLRALFAAGARQAQAGEFTRRAFLNGRLDLTQAEAVIDLIDAQTVQAAKNAAGQLGGAVSRKTDGVYDALCTVCSHYHAVLDYPDEDIPDFALRSYETALAQAERTLGGLLDTFRRGSVMKNGVRAAIIGRANVGKSSLLNALVGYDRAIVTPVAGTTRDTIEEKVILGGVLLRLMDTAGQRPTDDPVERLGVERAMDAARDAQLVIAVFDGSQPQTPQDSAVLAQALRAHRHVLVRNKSDLQTVYAPSGALPISAKTGEGIPSLEAAVAALFPEGAQTPAGEVLTSPRQADAVGRALESVKAAREAMLAGVTPDAVLTEVEQAMSALGELTGRTLREDITNGIFARFCVGK